ncbi:hypothetical protein Bca52824_030662 [Brassica carinata]|uniref:Uncharacterized protein n=1 Tax=Brassica carinata TaxID=52824 RepID=A0A8X7V5U7_BRACI|nr:hypothetical protein Bca52824_030662 [Brassica carinata]
MGSEHDHDEDKHVSENPLLEGDGEHKKILSEDTVIIHSETHSRSSSSSSSSSTSYSSPPKHLPAETDSPPVQVMDREDDKGTTDYDPDRIPSSVFETSKNLQADWSCASNESLFSIHLGRNSFTVDMMKSGELYKSGELLAYSPELPMPPPPGKETDPLVESSKVDDSDDEKEQLPAVSWKTPTKSYRSNRSSNSTHSFSFPILAGAASDSASVETGEQKKQEKQSEETKEPSEVENQKPSTMCGWFSWFPQCPWCCSLRSPCS